MNNSISKNNSLNSHFENINKECEKTSLIRELALLLGEDPIKTMYNNNGLTQVFGEYNDNDNLIETIKDIIKLNQTKLEDEKIKMRVNELKKYNVNIVEVVGGRKKKSVKRVSKKKSVKK